MNRTYIDKTAKLLKEIFLENDKLSIFMNSISIGKLTNQGQYHSLYNVRFPKNNATLSSTSRYDISSSSIRICDLSPREINMKSLYEEYTSDRRSIQSDSRFFYSNLFNNNWRQQIPSKKMGININKKANMKGYILNFVDMKKLMVSLIDNNRYDSVLDCVYEFYYVGDKNCLLAVSSINGLLYIRAQALQRLLDDNDKDTIKKTLNHLFVCYHTMFQKFSELNISEFKKEFIEDIQTSLLNKIMISDDINYKRFHYNPTSTPEQQLKNLKDYIQSTINELFRGGIFGIKDKYSYASIISKIIGNKKEREKEVYKEAYIKGMQTGLKMEMLGWKPCEVNFPDDQRISLWWSKEVNIIPDTFMYQNIRYSIPEKKREWKIDMLYVNQNGEMRCHGNHPNVSSSKVCMGDLSIDFTAELSVIQETLSRAATLLDMINYDSSYNHDGQDNLIKVSTVSDVLNIKSSTKIKMDGVRELGANFDDRDDDEEQEIPINLKSENNIIKLKNSKKETIVELIKTKIPTNDHRFIKNSDNDTEALDELESQEIQENQTPVYYTQDATVLQDITLVASNGERRPMVFISGPSTNPNISQQENLVLGDENILR